MGWKDSWTITSLTCNTGINKYVQYPPILRNCSTLLIKRNFRPVLPYVLGGSVTSLKSGHLLSCWQGCLCELQEIIQSIKHRLWTKPVSGVGCYPGFIGQSGTPNLAGRKPVKRLTLRLCCVLISNVASAQGKLWRSFCRTPKQS